MRHQALELLKRSQFLLVSLKLKVLSLLVSLLLGAKVLKNVGQLLHLLVSTIFTLRESL